MIDARRSRILLALLALVGLGFSPCGAELSDSPTKDAPPAPQACKTLDALAPALHEAVQGDNLSGVRQIVTELNEPPREGGAPVMGQVLQAVFVALHAFAKDPPEVGATDGLCNEAQVPPLNETNRLCDLRRVLKIYVHEGQASKSLHAFDPVVAGVLDYMIGKLPSADHPHYEIAADLESMCTQTGNCDPHDTFDLLQGVTSYLSPNRAQDLLAHVERLVDDPLLNGPGGLLSSLAAPDGGSAGAGASVGFELIAGQLVCALLEIDTTTVNGRAHYFDGIDSLLSGTVYKLIDSNYPPQDVPTADGGVFHSDLHQEVADAAADLKQMLNPDLGEPILQPMQRALTCATTSGASLCGRVLRPGFVPMIYHLDFEASVVELHDILGAVKELVTIDAHSEAPGLVMKLLHDVVAALNRDPEALDALTHLCHTFFQTERPCDDGRGNDCPALPLDYFPAGHAFAPHLDGCSNGAGASFALPNAACASNAEAALPEVASLFAQGVTDEVLCTLDTLVYGCAGGAQPACTATVGTGDGGP